MSKKIILDRTFKYLSHYFKCNIFSCKRIFWSVHIVNPNLCFRDLKVKQRKSVIWLLSKIMNNHINGELSMSPLHWYGLVYASKLHSPPVSPCMPKTGVEPPETRISFYGDSLRVRDRSIGHCLKLDMFRLKYEDISIFWLTHMEYEFGLLLL